MAKTLKEIASKVPSQIDWVLRVDGHTDKRPIRAKYPSNWELSQARALAVVKHLIEQGIPPNRLAPTGLASFIRSTPAQVTPLTARTAGSSSNSPNAERYGRQGGRGMPKRAWISAGLLIGSFLPAPALADAIDGNWCSMDGRSMSIAGPQIVTPGGTKMKGDYDRHGFRYVVPAKENPAGVKVDMSLVDDDTLQVTVGKGPMKTWRRCKPTS